MVWPLLLKENINSHLPVGESSRSREETGGRHAMASEFREALSGLVNPAAEVPACLLLPPDVPRRSFSGHTFPCACGLGNCTLVNF